MYIDPARTLPFSQVQALCTNTHTHTHTHTRWCAPVCTRLCSNKRVRRRSIMCTSSQATARNNANSRTRRHARKARKAEKEKLARSRLAMQGGRSGGADGGAGPQVSRRWVNYFQTRHPPTETGPPLTTAASLSPQAGSESARSASRGHEASGTKWNGFSSDSDGLQIQLY